jgi:excisionase family DNA binding protein
MVQGYYTLEEAARLLGMAAEELSQMAQRREVRAFADRGTWRFRTQDVEELARQRGHSSSAEVQLDEPPKAKASDSPRPKSAAKAPAAPEVFDFSLESSPSDQVEIGQEVIAEAPAAGKKGGSKSGGPKSPPPQPGSDSDVRLVPEGSGIDLQVSSDSDVKIVDDSVPSSTSDRKKKSSGPAAGKDSGVRLVSADVDSDSDVKMVPDEAADSALGQQPPKSPSDSDIRLEVDSGGKPKSGVLPAAGPPGDESFLTEEIDLDTELRLAEESALSPKAPSKVKPKAKPPEPPETSPFELSSDEIEIPTVPGSAKAEKAPDSSGEFDLTPGAVPEDQSPIELTGSDEFTLDGGEEDVNLGGKPAKKDVTGGKGKSGINIQDPADSGISLEKTDSDDAVEFELTLDDKSTPKPAPAKAEVDSDSEFELTLDESGGLAPLEEEGRAAAKEEEDIFETDFEVPPLDQESGSEAVALDDADTDLESSDFDLAIGDEDVAADEESGSQVVALEDEEEADEAAATVARPRRRRAADDEAFAEEGADDLEIEEEEAPRRRDLALAPAAAEWETWPAAVLLSCAFVLFLLGAMSFELLHNMWGYHQPYQPSGMVIRSISGLFVDDLPKD